MSYAILAHLSHSDPVVERFERWTRENLRDFSMTEAARAVGTTERTLQRRLRKVLGRTPIAYVRDLRVEQAIHLLRTTDQSVDEIAEIVGYQGGARSGPCCATRPVEGCVSSGAGHSPTPY